MGSCRKVLLFCLFWIIVVFSAFYSTYLLRIFFPYPLRPLIEANSEKYSLDPLLVVAIIKVESNFNPTARSKKGAVGFMQVMPQTAEWIAQQSGLKFNKEDLLKPEHNISYGCWYLNFLQQEFSYKLPLVICAYNSGHFNVHSWLKNKTWDGSLENSAQIPFEETKIYLKKVVRTYYWYQKLYGNNSPMGGKIFFRILAGKAGKIGEK